MNEPCNLVSRRYTCLYKNIKPTLEKPSIPTVTRVWSSSSKNKTSKFWESFNLSFSFSDLAEEEEDTIKRLSSDTQIMKGAGVKKKPQVVNDAGEAETAVETAGGSGKRSGDGGFGSDDGGGADSVLREMGQ
ncbi:hypothetical protein YC2023_119544 [Brassica napus]